MKKKKPKISRAWVITMVLIVVAFITVFIATMPEKMSEKNKITSYQCVGTGKGYCTVPVFNVSMIAFSEDEIKEIYGVSDISQVPIGDDQYWIVFPEPSDPADLSMQDKCILNMNRNAYIPAWIQPSYNYYHAYNSNGQRVSVFHMDVPSNELYEFYAFLDPVGVVRIHCFQIDPSRVMVGNID